MTGAVRTTGDIGITLAGERVVLTPERAAWWPAERTLFVSDTHWGKARAMRRHGLPVPAGSTAEQLGRLASAVERLGAERVVHLGDMIHAPVGVTDELIEMVCAWRRRCPVELALVRGNHDFRRAPRRLAETLERWGIEDLGDAAELGPFSLRHDPFEAGGDAGAGFVISGHVHPAIGLGGRQKNIPCYWVRPGGLVLPAMSVFTGGVRFRPGPEDELYAVAEGAVVRV